MQNIATTLTNQLRKCCKCGTLSPAYTTTPAYTLKTTPSPCPICRNDTFSNMAQQQNTPSHKPLNYRQ